MSPARTADEVERSLEDSRAELEVALADLRTSLRRATDVRARRDRVVELARTRVENDRGELAAGALAVGFVAGGGVGGTLHAPAKLVRVTLRRPSSKSGLEAAMRQDRHSKQLGRALAAVAAADGHLRSRRGRLTGFVRPTARRLFLLGSAGGGIFMAMTDEKTRASFEEEAVAAYEALRDALMARVDQIGK